MIVGLYLIVSTRGQLAAALVSNVVVVELREQRPHESPVIDISDSASVVTLRSEVGERGPVRRLTRAEEAVEVFS